jgi:hypothetical protein
VSSIFGSERLTGALLDRLTRPHPGDEWGKYRLATSKSRRAIAADPARPAAANRNADVVVGNVGEPAAGLDGDHGANAQRVCVSAQVSKFEQLSVYKKRTASVYKKRAAAVR